MSIVICPLSLIQDMVDQRRPSHMITLLDPDHVIPTPRGLEPDRHLRLGVHDIVDETEGLVRADESLVADLVAFGAGWDERAPILIHCWAGISRSTASAFVLACERNPDADETLIAAEIRKRSATATPNRRIVTLADDLLGRRGRMVDAVDKIGRGVRAYEGLPFELPSRW